MELMTVFRAMMSEITSDDGSETLVNGILLWASRTSDAVRRARQHDAAQHCLEASFSGASTWRLWKYAADNILAALIAQEDEARARRATAEREAAARESRAAEADAGAAVAADQARASRARAATARTRAGEARTLAGTCENPETAAAFEAQASACDAQAAAADSDAQAGESAAAALAGQAEKHRERARLERARSKELRAWEASARDAHGTGTLLIAVQQPVQNAMYEGIQAAGGINQVPRSKYYLRRDATTRRPAMAGRGGYQ
jgi:hypothetical protein